MRIWPDPSMYLFQVIRAGIYLSAEVHVPLPQPVQMSAALSTWTEKHYFGEICVMTTSFPVLHYRSICTGSPVNQFSHCWDICFLFCSTRCLSTVNMFSFIPVPLAPIMKPLNKVLNKRGWKKEWPGNYRSLRLLESCRIFQNSLIFYYHICTFLSM